MSCILEPDHKIRHDLLLSLNPYTEDELRKFISEQRQSNFSYREVGASANSVPAGYAIDRNRILLGAGERAWILGVSAIRHWRMFNIPWIRLYWPNTEIRVGSEVAVEVRRYGFHFLNACRIVYLLDENGPIMRYGFAYGTLHEHVESGEERFTVEWNKNSQEVWYDILAFSRPNKLLAKLAYPITRSLQRQFAVASKLAMFNACQYGSDEYKSQNT